MEQQQDLLQHVEQEIYLERVTPGVRFANFLIDLVVYYALLFAAVFLLGSFGLLTKRVDYYGNASINEKGLYYMVVFGINIAYYTICEAAFKGKTLGKLITGSKTVMLDGSAVTWKNAFLRTLSRLVPFEPFSAFSGNPWHDQWTNTQVVKARSV